MPAKTLGVVTRAQKSVGGEAPSSGTMSHHSTSRTPKLTRGVDKCVDQRLIQILPHDQLRVPLHTDAEARRDVMVDRLNRLRHAIGCFGDNAHPRPRFVHCFIVNATDLRKPSRLQYLMQATAATNADGMLPASRHMAVQVIASENAQASSQSDVE